MFSKKLLILIIPLAILWYLWSLVDKKTQSKKVSSPSQAKAIPEQKRVKKGNLATQAVRDARKTANLSIGLGVQSIPLTTEKINFTMTPVKRGCATGDYDLILMGVARSKKARLLVVLESLSDPGRNGKKNRRIVRPLDFAKGLNLSFDLKKFEKPDLLGLYICVANGSDRTCRNKKAVNFQKAYTDYLNKKKSGDRLYYYQTLLLTNNSLSTINGQFLQSEGPRKLQSWLKAKSPGLKISQRSLQNILSTHEKLNSVPTEIRGHNILLELPYSETKCKLPGIAELRKTFPTPAGAEGP